MSALKSYVHILGVYLVLPIRIRTKCLPMCIAFRFVFKRCHINKARHFAARFYLSTKYRIKTKGLENIKFAIIKLADFIIMQLFHWLLRIFLTHKSFPLDPIYEPALEALAFPQWPP